jgi:hypothetical protein
MRIIMVTPCRNAEIVFLNAKTELYQWLSTDIVQSKAAIDHVIAAMKINILANISLLANRLIIPAVSLGGKLSSLRDNFLIMEIKIIHKVKYMAILA